jgi:hypothetical protein
MVTVTSSGTAPGANVTVARPSALVTLPPAAAVISPSPAGGDSPLLVFAVGSGEAEAAPVGVAVVPLVSVEVLLVVAGVGEPEDEPEAPLVPLPVADTSVLEDGLVACTPDVVSVATVVWSDEVGALTEPSEPELLVVEPPVVVALVVSLGMVEVSGLPDEPVGVEPLIVLSAGAFTVEPETLPSTWTLPPEPVVAEPEELVGPAVAAVALVRSRLAEIDAGPAPEANTEPPFGVIVKVATLPSALAPLSTTGAPTLEEVSVTADAVNSSTAIPLSPAVGSTNPSATVPARSTGPLTVATFDPSLTTAVKFGLAASTATCTDPSGLMNA